MLKLSDLLMIQNVGEYDKFIDKAITGEMNEEYINEIREKATLPNTFKKMLEKTISHQVGAKTKSLRELGQNARDSYNDEKEKDINFFLDLEKNKLTVKDNGCGMSPKVVFTDLLVAYNSSKFEDQNKIGEHGVGFFTNLDISNKVIITTRNGTEQKTKVVLEKIVDDWKVDYKINNEPFKGTSVTLQLDDFMSLSTVTNALVKNLGFLDKSYNLTLNEVKLNRLREFYEVIGEGDVKGKNATVAISKKDFSNEKFFYDKNEPNYLILTQDGFHVINPDIRGIVNDDVLADLLERMNDLGYRMWVDIPNNVSLTKGRNNVVSRHVNSVREGITEAFTQGLMERILEDDNFVYDMDRNIADVVKHVLQTKEDFSSRFKRVVKPFYDAGKVFLNPLTYFVMGKSIFESVRHGGLSEPIQIDLKVREEVTEEEIKEYVKLKGFSEKLLNKEIIKLYESKPKTSQSKSGSNFEFLKEKNESYDKENNLGNAFILGLEYNYKKISVLEFISLYQNKKVEVKNYTDVTPDKSFVRTNPIIDAVLEVTSAKHRTINLSINMMKFLDKFGLIGEYVGQAYMRAKEGIQALLEKNTDNQFGTRTKLFVESRVKKQGIGEEYLTLIKQAKYIDGLICQAVPKLKPTNINIQGKYDLEIASTNMFSTKLNVYNDKVNEYIESIVRGEFFEETAISFIELMIHERTHDSLGVFSKYSSHGKKFYKQKTEIRNAFCEYCKENSIDPHQELNNITGVNRPASIQDVRNLFV